LREPVKTFMIAVALNISNQHVDRPPVRHPESLELPMAVFGPKPGTHAARILLELGNHPGGASDAHLARILDVRHQIVNANCRKMEVQGLIARKQVDGVILNHELRKNLQRSSGEATAVASPKPSEAAMPGNDGSDREQARDIPRQSADTTVERPWFWEGNVQTAVAVFLRNEGWTVRRIVDTKSKEQGKDIVLENADDILWVTVKGFPARTPRTQPATQARHWFAAALFDIVSWRQEARAQVGLAIALPDFPTYRRLAQRTKWIQEVAPFDYLWVSRDGEVKRDSGRPSRC
jgi:hypothetical protein